MKLNPSYSIFYTSFPNLLRLAIPTTVDKQGNVAFINIFSKKAYLISFCVGIPKDYKLITTVIIKQIKY